MSGKMERPRIGITTSYNEGEQRLDVRYVQAVERAGGLPMIVPMMESGEAAALFAEMLDGLVVTGGPAVEDGIIGELPDDILPTDPIRVASDTRILGLFSRRSPACSWRLLWNATHQCADRWTDLCRC